MKLIQCDRCGRKEPIENESAWMVVSYGDSEIVGVVGGDDLDFCDRVCLANYFASRATDATEDAK